MSGHESSQPGSDSFGAELGLSGSGLMARNGGSEQKRKKHYDLGQ